jgi:hypothetical protein
MSKFRNKKDLDKKSPNKFSTMFGWWVGLVFRAKLNVLFCVGCGRGNSSFNFVKRGRIFLSVQSGTLACNVLRLGEGGDLKHSLPYEAHTSNLRKTVLRRTEPPLLPNRCVRLEW